MSTAWHVSFLRFLKADFFVKINIYIALRARVVLNILALRRCSGASRIFKH